MSFKPISSKLTGNIFFTHFLEIFDKHASFRKFSIRRDHPRWFSDDIIPLCANWDYLYVVGRRTNNGNLISEATKLKNFIRHALPKFKSEYFQNLLEKDKQDPKNFGGI